MGPRLRLRHLPCRAAVLAALAALLACAAAWCAAPPALAEQKKAKAPVITSLSPKHVAVGEMLTFRGRHFRSGRRKNTVVFKRGTSRAVFTKADLATKKLLRVTVPGSLQKYFAVVSGTPVATRFRVRILARKFGRKFTSRRLSPIVSGPRPSTVTAPDGDCDGDGVPNRLETDADDDLLSDAEEVRIRTNLCVADTDGDTITDGFEYRSALDLNDDKRPQPKPPLASPMPQPYPNAGYPDGDTDYDGDSLTLKEEYELWVYTYTVTGTDPRSLDALSYSDGEQSTRSVRGAGGRREPTLSRDDYDKHEQFVAWAVQSGHRSVMLSPPVGWNQPQQPPVSHDLFDVNRAGGETATERAYHDLDGNGYLSDAERDEDADGLTNYDETHGRMTAGYWTGCYSIEARFQIGYEGPSYLNADTDGNGVRDGADDQDHDDVPNVMELSRIAASGISDREPGKLCTPATGLDPLNNHPNSYGRVNPFNPCLPHRDSRTCPRFVSSGTGAPFDGSPNWYSLN